MEDIVNQVLIRTEKIKARYDELSELITYPEIIADNRLWRRFLQERASIEDVANGYVTLKKYVKDYEKCIKDLNLTSSCEFKELLNEEIEALQNKIDSLTLNMLELLVPKDKIDERNVIVEIRCAENREDSYLFTADLLQMYEKYSGISNYKFELVDTNYADNGGVKNANVIISGKGVYARFRNESGIHKAIGMPYVLSGKSNTASATVTVLPQMEDIIAVINDNNIRIDVFHASGAGGQNINKVETAIRITHLPTGIVVTCQDERSQLKNKERAMSVLRSKVYEYYKEKQDTAFKKERTELIGAVKNNVRIRTYNYTSDKVTDHRVNMTVALNGILSGQLDTLIDAVIILKKENKLANI